MIWSEVPRGRQALQRDGLGPKACVFDHISRLTRASVRGQVVLTSCFERIALCSDAHGFNLLSRVSWAMPKVPQGQPAVPGDLGPVLWAGGVD